MKKTIAVIAAVLMLGSMLTACGKNKKEADSDIAATESTVAATAAETVKPAETTAEGNTVEKDSEGNSIEKDKNGRIVSVRDKNGTVIEVTEYIKTHPSADEDSGKAALSSGNNDIETEAKPESVSSAGDATGKPEQQEEQPTVYPDISADTDEYELPIIFE